MLGLGLTLRIRADVWNAGCLDIDPSVWFGHSPDTHRSDGVTYREPVLEARRGPVHPSRQVWCHPNRLSTEQMTMTTLALRITAGVDTHLDVHVVAALDERGPLSGVKSFETTAEGYRQTLGLVGWVRHAGARRCRRHRQLRRRSHPPLPPLRVSQWSRWTVPIGSGAPSVNKSDPQDAIAAARAAESGDAGGAAKTRDGNVEAMRVLRIARHSAKKARTQALNQMRSITSTAPDEISPVASADREGGGHALRVVAQLRAVGLVVDDVGLHEQATAAGEGVVQDAVLHGQRPCRPPLLGWHQSQESGLKLFRCHPTSSRDASTTDTNEPRFIAVHATPRHRVERGCLQPTSLMDRGHPRVVLGAAAETAGPASADLSEVADRPRFLVQHARPANIWTPTPKRCVASGVRGKFPVTKSGGT